MKILLKDVISESPGCKDLLCSYFFKTILFWLSEELPTSMWKKDNLIPCFMKCVKRLIYCVEQSMCPHYFIPENNLFENKIIGHGRRKLLETLYILIDYGWQCIFFSANISMVSLICTVQFKVDLFLNNIQKIIKSKVTFPRAMCPNVKLIDFVGSLQIVFASQTQKLRSLLLLNMTQTGLIEAQMVLLSGLQSNHNIYKRYKQCLCNLLLSTYHDAATGWLMLVSLFYKNKQYNKALCVLSYLLQKITREKLYFGANLSHIHRELFRFKTFRKRGIIRTLRILFLPSVIFYKKDYLIPNEIKTGATDLNPAMITPVIYLHFLTFLCHYHLHNIGNYQESLSDLRLTIESVMIMLTNL
ncbi:uncharacterized protein LOC127721014 [Mytilus californianus]|uniref:uncharacterized protein LOC127721014 n=1 Tax=Mytilus californianus TaxID=6549 RepID=UPI0022453F21|nr:uncharacterized protein LOC127721014 [Mytilus californianus]